MVKRLNMKTYQNSIMKKKSWEWAQFMTIMCWEKDRSQVIMVTNLKLSFH